MAGFDDWAKLQRLHDGTDRWKLCNDLIYRTEAGSIYTVPRGMKTDLASIPRILWSIYPPFDDYASAAVLHDHFCNNDWISRKDGDLIFREAMSYSNVNKFDRTVIYSAVRGYALLWRIK